MWSDPLTLHLIELNESADHKDEEQGHEYAKYDVEPQQADVFVTEFIDACIGCQVDLCHYFWNLPSPEYFVNCHSTVQHLEVIQAGPL